MQARKLKLALTIAGSDPSGGAGVQSDLKTFSAIGVYGCSAITMVIAQNASRVICTAPVDAAMVTAQIAAVFEERRPDSIKTGALGNAAIVRAVANAIGKRGPALVVDPVMISSSGTRLLDFEGEHALVRELLPIAAILTPNIPEARALTGIEIDGVATMRAAAESIGKMGARAVLVKGGHLSANLPAADVLYDGRAFVELAGERIAGADVHGTGCVLSAAIAAHIATGKTLEESVRAAKRFVAAAIQNRIILGAGRAVPNHRGGKRR